MSAILESVLTPEQRQQCDCNDAKLARGEAIASPQTTVTLPPPLPALTMPQALRRYAITCAIAAAFVAGHLVGATKSPKVIFLKPTTYSMKVVV